jgi:hypothetical protein
MRNSGKRKTRVEKMVPRYSLSINDYDFINNRSMKNWKLKLDIITFKASEETKDLFGKAVLIVNRKHYFFIIRNRGDGHCAYLSLASALNDLFFDDGPERPINFIDIRHFIADAFEELVRLPSTNLFFYSNSVQFAIQLGEEGYFGMKDPSARFNYFYLSGENGGKKFFNKTFFNKFRLRKSDFENDTLDIGFKYPHQLAEYKEIVIQEFRRSRIPKSSNSCGMTVEGLDNYELFLLMYYFRKMVNLRVILIGHQIDPMQPYGNFDIMRRIRENQKLVTHTMIFYHTRFGRSYGHQEFLRPIYFPGTIKHLKERGLVQYETYKYQGHFPWINWKI